MIKQQEQPDERCFRSLTRWKIRIAFLILRNTYFWINFNYQIFVVFFFSIRASHLAKKLDENLPDWEQTERTAILEITISIELLSFETKRQMQKQNKFDRRDWSSVFRFKERKNLRSLHSKLPAQSIGHLTSYISSAFRVTFNCKNRASEAAVCPTHSENKLSHIEFDRKRERNILYYKWVLVGRDQ